MFGLVQVASRPIKLLIAVSILVSVIHALRPLFPGREAIIAASLGLVHGLAFASALNELGVTGWYRLISLLGFNLGIESLQLAVVAVTFPALILLSRTQWHVAARVTGTMFAMIASVPWIAERTLNQSNIIGERLANVAQPASCSLALFGSQPSRLASSAPTVDRVRLHSPRLTVQNP